MLIDTHTHLYLKDFDADREEMLQRALDAGVVGFYLPNIDSTSIGPMLSLEAAYPTLCHAMMGLHPCSVQANFEDELKAVETWLSDRPFPAIGEIGIDLFWDKTFVEQQIRAFRTQINWAKELHLPIVIHSRDSIDLIIDILQQEKDERLRGIFHCFTGTAAQAAAVMSLGFLIGIGGVVTFKNSGLDVVVENIPLEWLVLETDSPYLAPVPFRGKRNESAYIRIVAEKLAAVKAIDFETVAQATTQNAKKIFGDFTLAYTTLS